MLFVQGKNHLRRRVGFLCVAQEKKKRLVMDLLKKIQVLKTGPLESNENWHAALKWRVMTKCKICILAKNVLERRYLNFFVWRGALKMCFLDFIIFCVILVPWWSGMRRWCARRVIWWWNPLVNIFFQFWENLKNVGFKTTYEVSKIWNFVKLRKSGFYVKIVSAVADLVGIDIENTKIDWKLQFLWHF